MAVNCVNTKSKEFKDTAQRLNISAANLENIVFEYQNTEGNKDGFPEDSYIVDKLYGERDTVGINVFDLYQKEYQQPRIFLTSKDLQRGMAEATDFFHPKSVTGYKNNSGQYVMLVAKPKLRAEDRTDYNKVSNSTARKSLIQNYKESIDMADRQAAFDTAIASITELFNNYTPVSKDAFDANDELSSKADDIEAKFSDYIESAKFVPAGNGKFRLELVPKSFDEIMDRLITDHVNNMSEDKVVAELEANEMGIGFDLQYHLNRKKEEEARRVIAKKNTKITPEELDNAIEFLKSLENNPDLNQYVAVCINWLKDNQVRLPEDNEKLLGYFKEARRLGIDTQRLKTPVDLVLQVYDAQKETAVDGTPLNPDEMQHFTFNREVVTDKGTIRIYDVEDNLEGQTDVCNILAAASPKDSKGKPIVQSPWCLSNFNYDVATGKATPVKGSIELYWPRYSKGKRQIAFLDGLPVAFNSHDNSKRVGEDLWWDFKDKRHNTIEEIDTSLVNKVFEKERKSLGKNAWNVLFKNTVGDTDTAVFADGRISKKRIYRKDPNSYAVSLEAELDNNKKERVGFMLPQTRGISSVKFEALKRWSDVSDKYVYYFEGPIAVIIEEGQSGFLPSFTVDILGNKQEVRVWYNNSIFLSNLSAELEVRVPDTDEFIKIEIELPKYQSGENVVRQIKNFLNSLNTETISDIEVSEDLIDGIKEANDYYSNTVIPSIQEAIDTTLKEKVEDILRQKSNPRSNMEEQSLLSEEAEEASERRMRYAEIYGDIDEIGEEPNNPNAEAAMEEYNREVAEMEEAFRIRDVEEEINQNNILNELEQSLDPARNYEYSVEEYAELGSIAELANQEYSNNREYSDNEGEITVDDVKTARDILKEGKLQKLYNDKVQQPLNKELEQKLSDILKKYHWETLEADLKAAFGDDVLGAIDTLEKVIYLANEGDRNALTYPEEFSHAFIEMLGSKYRREGESRKNHPENRLYSELRDMVVDTSLYKQVLSRYKDKYVLANGNTDTALVAKEALGQALAAVLTNKYEAKTQEDRRFVRKLKDWFNKVLQWFKGQFNKEEKLVYELNKMADSILDGTYAAKYFKDSGIDGLIEANLDNTLREQIRKDGGKALAIMSILKDKGLKMGGSLSLRAQGTLYRKEQDNLHDLDYSVPPAVHQISGINGFGSRIFYNISEAEAAHIKDVVENSPFMTDLVASIPGATIADTYATGPDIITNIVISDNAEAKAKFLSLKGSYSDRLNQLTQKERDSIYLLDVFMNPHTKETTTVDSEVAGQIPALHSAPIFEAKFKMGRPKDVKDFRHFNPFNRRYRTSGRGLMFQSTGERTNPTSGERKISYTTTDKNGVRKEREFTVDGNRIINKEGKEIYKTESADRNKILGKYAVQTGTAVVVSAKGSQYIVHNDNRIISVNTGKRMAWGEENGLRKQILEAAQKRFEEKAKAQEARPQATDAETDLANALMSQNNQQMSNYVNHSGGARGADNYWGETGAKYGVTSNHYYHETKTTYGNKEITQEDMVEGQQKVTAAAKAMYGFQGNIQSPLLIRNWSQVKYADAIFAVSTMLRPGDKIKDDPNDNRVALIPQVKGGTGYAVQMAISEGKPVYVFDQVRNQWYKNTDGKWEISETPTLTPNFAGIGTRELNEAGKRAIEEVYKKTSEALNPGEKAKQVLKTNTETKRVLGNDERAEQEVKDAVAVAKAGIALEKALEGVDAVFTPEEIAQIKSVTPDGKLRVMSVSRETDPVFFSKEIVDFLKRNSSKPFNDPTRVNAIEIWTKHDGESLQDILQACKEYKVAPMVSFSITGLGNTALERGVMKYEDLLNLIEGLIKVGDLNPATTTVRIDPILVGETNLEDIKKIVNRAKELGIKKFVTSLVQSYGYLDGTPKDRKVTSGINNALAKEERTYDWDKYYGIITREDFQKSRAFVQQYQREHPGATWMEKVSAGLKKGIRVVTATSVGKIHFVPKQEYIDEVAKVLLELNQDPDIEIETCSFPVKGLANSACLDPLIIERVTGVNVTSPTGTYDRDTSRPDCMCYGGHQDMFRRNEKSCYSSCAYCYAAHSTDNNLDYYNEDGTLKDNRFTRVRASDDLTPSFYHVRVETEDRGPKGINKTYMDKDTRVSYQIDALYNSDKMSATEVSEIAAEVMYWISDYITRLQTDAEFAKKEYQDKFEGKDLSKMSRLDIINMITISKLLERAKENFDPAVKGEGKFVYDDLEVMWQMREVVDNWEGIVTIGAATFAEIEKINIISTEDGEVVTATETTDKDPDDYSNTDTPEGAVEERGSLQEGWQVESKTKGLLDTMSPLVKHAYRECYVLTDTGRKDADGEPIYEKVQSARGVNKRVGMREAANQIQRWTQGAFTIEQVKNKLKAKEALHPWVSQIRKKLEDTSGEYSIFQSQFISNLRTFQSYYVVSEDNIGKLISKPANRNPVLSATIKSVKTAVKLGEHYLFHNGQINKTTYNELSEIGKTLVRMQRDDISNPDIRNTISENLSRAANLLGFGITAEDISSVLTDKMFSDTRSALLGMLTYNLAKNLENTNYEPFKMEANGQLSSFERNLRRFFAPLMEYFNDIMENAVNEGGKTYQSFVIPSYLSMMFQKIREVGVESDNYIDNEWGKYSFFKNQKGGRDAGWIAPWIGELARDASSRRVFDHKVQLSFNKKGYQKANYMKNMNDADYMLSVLSEYFSEKDNITLDRIPAWFRVPIQSNKPSSEFIKFYSERGTNYRENIVEGLKNIFNQELLRIRTVELRNLKEEDHDFIKNFDEKGRDFCFLEYMNDYLIKYDENGNKIMPSKGNTKLAKYIREFLDGNVTHQSELYDEAKAVIMEAMKDKVAAMMRDYTSNGIMEALKKKVSLGRFKTAEEAMENFLWNDTFASLNIFEITVGDLAFYKDTEDLQKRFAQIHAPGIRGNRDARDLKGNLVTDGNFRMVKLKDWDDYKSNMIANIEVAFDRKIKRAEEAGNTTEANSYRNLKEGLVGKDGLYRQISVTDAQAFNCPTSYKKKALTMGKWDKEAEALYEKIINRTATYSDIEKAFQPRKPFGYSQVEKPSLIDAEYAMNRIKDPVQYKNSEYLLIMADAITRGEDTGMPNLLRAIYDIMEESHYTTDKDGKRVYSTKGIDTIMFDTAVKSGATGVVGVKDLNKVPFAEQFDGEAQFRNWLNSYIYNEDGSYNLSTVDVFPVEDYCEQQEIPEHYKDHEQARGSQVTAITPSELETTTTDSEGNEIPATYALKDKDGNVRQVDAQTFKKDYEKTVSDGIEASIEELRKELCLDSPNKLERNLALSKILKAEIASNFSRYGIDLWLACSVDKETGDFRIPLGDSSQAKRVEQLINSVIKNRVNKQTMPGGPVVQVTNFGTSRQLHIRFKDKNGGMLKTEDQWNKAPEGKSYKEYIEKNQAGIAHFEVFAPLYMKDMLQMFMDNEGVIDFNAIEQFNPDLLKMIGYRIPTEDKYSSVPCKIVGFLPREAGDGIMMPYEITRITGCDFDVDKMYTILKKLYIAAKFANFDFEKLSEENLMDIKDKELAYIQSHKNSIIKHIVEAINLRTTLSKEEKQKALNSDEHQYQIRKAKELHEKNLADIESRADFSRDINDEIESDKQFDRAEHLTDKAENRLIKRENERYEKELKRIEEKTLEREVNKKIYDMAEQFLDIQRFMNSQSDDALMSEIRKAYMNYMYEVTEPTEGKGWRDNHLFDMMYEVLTHETSVDKILNPQGFEPQKQIAYAIAAYRQFGDQYSFEDLYKMDVKKLKSMIGKSKNLAYIDTQIQFYKQNAAAGSLIGIFAVHRIAHAILESESPDGNPIYYIDINGTCGTTLPFKVAGMEFGSTIFEDGKEEGNNRFRPFSQRYDEKRERIGKVLGSLVGASADAVKDPILNLMNISKETANILCTLIKMGMPFDNAALFLSQKVISDVLAEYNRKNLLKHTSLDRIIEDRIKAIEGKLKLKDSKAETEDLSVKQLIEGLRDSSNLKNVYKTLKAFQHFQKIAEAMKMPMAVTRKNSITSATGPLIVDNIMTEMKERRLAEVNTIWKKEGRNYRAVTMDEIYKSHPILESYRKGFDIAKEVFRDMPAYSSGFKRIVEIALNTDLADTFINDRNLVSSLSDFFQTYMCMAAGVIDMSDADRFLKDFPKEFLDAKYKELYKDNALIQSLQVDEDARGRMTLVLNTTGLQGTSIAKYQDAWTDLHKKNPQLSIDLWKYCVYRGGVGFNPKTFLNCLPVYVRERIPGYIDAFRHIPEVDASSIIDQFIRNNTDEDRLVPWKREVKLNKETGKIDEEDEKGLRFERKGNILELYDKKQVEEMEKVPYFKMKYGYGFVLYRKMGTATYDGKLRYQPVKALGLDGHMEMSLSNSDKASLEQRKIEELNKEFSSEPMVDRTGDMEVDLNKLEYTPEQLRDIMYKAVIIEGIRDEAEAEEWLQKKREYSKERKKREEKNLKDFFRRQLTKKNIPFNEKTIDDIMEQENLC